MRAIDVAAAILCATAWGCQAGEDEPAFPSRDWSGSYALEVVRASTDCTGAESPPELGRTVLTVRQSPDNDAVLEMGPLIVMNGRLDGDELEAKGSIVQPIALPDSLLERVSPADSLESIGYAMALEFAEGQTLAGRYVIRAPDLNALSRGVGPGRCEYVYEVRGVPITGGPGAGEGIGAVERP